MYQDFLKAGGDALHIQYGVAAVTLSLLTHNQSIDGLQLYARPTQKKVENKCYRHMIYLLKDHKGFFWDLRGQKTWEDVNHKGYEYSGQEQLMSPERLENCLNGSLKGTGFGRQGEKVLELLYHVEKKHKALWEQEDLQSQTLTINHQSMLKKRL